MTLSDFSVILLYDVDPDWTPTEQDEARHDAARLEVALRDCGYRVVSVQVCDTDLHAVLEPFDPRRHIVLNWCEQLPGQAHSEGGAAMIIESFGYVYTGSSPEVLMLSEDKCKVKERLLSRHIATPRWMLVDESRKTSWSIFPAIVKAAWEHGSTGLSLNSVVMNPLELNRQIARMQREVAGPVMVEEFIEGREFHVTVWGNGHISLLPPVEIDFSAFEDLRSRLFTYDSKFRSRSAHYRKIRKRRPDDLSAAASRKLARVCKAAYRAIGCRDYARIEVRWRRGVFYVLDVNPNPDISQDCCMAFAAEQAGISYGGMGSRLLALAVRRHTQLPGARRQ